MIKSFYFLIISIIFVVISLLHFFRLMFELDILIGRWLMPGWISGAIIIISILIVYWSLKMEKKQNENENEKTQK